MEKVILYCGTELNVSVATRIITSLKMQVLLVEDDQLENTLGDILDENQLIRSAICASTSLFENAVMIFDGLSDERITALSQAFQDAGCQFQGVKAVVTKHNRTWKLIDLFREIQAEHEFFKTYDALKNALITCNQFQKEDYTPTSWVQFQGVMLEAYLTYQTPHVDHEDIIKAYQQLQAGIKQLVKLSA